jgi:NAD(P)-dependent dehydrogenase (short-subunit alcohol dehydrogenase family)
MRFRDLSVLITGAAGGFGRLAAQRFAEEGARLTLQDIAEGGLAETAELVKANGGEVVRLAGDVSREAHAKALVDLAVATYGRLDIALNNAGIGGRTAAIPDTPLDEYERIMAINARGVFLGLKYQIPAMKKAGGGSILNTASAAGVLGAGHIGSYAASKHAVVGLTRAAADETARHNIRVNAICPAFAVTPMFEQMSEEMFAGRNMTREESLARMTTRVPMRRVGTAEEVVQAMLWIVSPGNSFMTGQAVSIDGGLSAV